MNTISFPVRVVFYYELDRWIAHCLEFDLLGDGVSQAEALQCLTEAIELQVAASVEHSNIDNLFHPAEGRIFTMFAQGKQVAVGELSIQSDNIDLREVEARVFGESVPDMSCFNDPVTP